MARLERSLVLELLDGLVRDNPEHAALAALQNFLCPAGVVDSDRFAAVMVFATRLVAFDREAATRFAEQVSQAQAS